MQRDRHVGIVAPALFADLGAAVLPGLLDGGADVPMTMHTGVGVDYVSKHSGLQLGLEAVFLGMLDFGLAWPHGA